MTTNPPPRRKTACHTGYPPSWGNAAGEDLVSLPDISVGFPGDAVIGACDLALAPLLPISHQITHDVIVSWLDPVANSRVHPAAPQWQRGPHHVPLTRQTLQWNLLHSSSIPSSSSSSSSSSITVAAATAAASWSSPAAHSKKPESFLKFFFFFFFFVFKSPCEIY